MIGFGRTNWSIWIIAVLVSPAFGLFRLVGQVSSPLTAGAVERVRLSEVVESAVVDTATPNVANVGDTSAYELGPGDQISIWVRDSEEIRDRSFRVTTSGTIRLPLVGSVPVAGLTIHEVETELLKRFDAYFYEPEVTVTITDFRSQPISVLGSVQRPGVQQLSGRMTLVEALSAAGGLTADAGNVAAITRDLSYGNIPVQGARLDTTGRFSVAELEIDGLLTGNNPDANILLQPHDVIAIEKADVVYVIGEVNRAGGFILGRRQEVSVLQVIAMAEGTRPSAALGSAKILRPVPGETRKEISIDLKKIILGKAEDLRLQPQDILVVPDSPGKRAMKAALALTLGLGSGIALWRLGR
jgi:polysaccharide export outer membrane protein